MTHFSNLLYDYITAKDIRIYPFAQYCDIDRSNMYKLINGKRNPTSEKVIHKMADFMRLTPHERNELLEAYHITLVGPETFHRRKNVHDFITHFSGNTKEFSDISAYFTTAFDLKSSTDLLSLSGSMELKHAIYSILSQESQLLNGEIHLIMQPDSDFIMDTLAYIGKTKNDLSIDHIICLNNDDSLTTDKKDYNLRCLQNIIPMYRTCNCRYTPYYYYDSIVSHNNKFNLLSSMILTSEYGICFSPSLKYGVLFRSQEIRSKLLSVFRDLLKDTRPLVCRFDSVFSQLEYFDKLGLGSSPGISFQKEPCLMPLLPPSYIDKYLIDELPNRDYTILSIKEVRRPKLPSPVCSHLLSQSHCRGMQ